MMGTIRRLGGPSIAAEETEAYINKVTDRVIKTRVSQLREMSQIECIPYSPGVKTFPLRGFERLPGDEAHLSG